MTYSCLKARPLKDPIDADEEMVQFAKESGAHYLMDASTLRHFMSDPWPYRDETFAVKLVVSRRSYGGSRLCYTSLCPCIACGRRPFKDPFGTFSPSRSRCWCRSLTLST